MKLNVEMEDGDMFAYNSDFGMFLISKEVYLLSKSNDGAAIEAYGPLDPDTDLDSTIEVPPLPASIYPGSFDWQEYKSVEKNKKGDTGDAGIRGPAGPLPTDIL